MSCLPNTPVVENILSATNSIDLGWIEIPSVTNTALQQFYPVNNAVMQMDNLAQTTNQHVQVLQLQIEEYATSNANIRQAPLKVCLYNNTAPTTPVLGGVYNPSTTNLVGVFNIAGADYTRVSETVYVATTKPQYWFRTGTSNAPNVFFAVVLSNDAGTVTYATGATLRIKVITQVGTAL
jgi:hypothetical protein